jgi:protein TonB
MSELDNGVLRPPLEIPKYVAMVREEEAPSGSTMEVRGSVPGGLPNGVPNSGITTIIRDVPVAVPKIAAQKVRVSSGVAQGLLVHQVTPQYPTLARQARIQGTVILQAVIGKDGTVQNLRVLSGHPMLVQSAIDAVRQWRYKPYYLNGEPVEVDTQINVNFTLAGG